MLQTLAANGGAVGVEWPISATERAETEAARG
jgi:hypothetical protein